MLEFILQSQAIEYGVFDEIFQLQQHSPRLLLLHKPPPSEKGILDIFPELIGYDEILHAVARGEHEPLCIEYINSVGLMAEGSYLSLTVHPYNKGLLVIARDVSFEGKMEQRITQRRNELDLLAGKLVIDLESANFNLKQAYETTMQGWSKALEMRDSPTRGHSQRVTELAIKLAREIGVVEDEHLMHIWRGSLLHDIGKMSLPDSILFKPGPLSEEEWEIMRQHPLFAVELLSPIAYLQESLDIPYYHHEKWDGSGYPFGLKGEQIPLAARIFAIVDAWDALTSERLYQKAIPPEKALEIIQQDSGTHFDPKIVEAFVRLYNCKEI